MDESVSKEKCLSIDEGGYDPTIGCKTTGPDERRGNRVLSSEVLLQLLIDPIIPRQEPRRRATHHRSELSGLAVLLRQPGQLLQTEVVITAQIKQLLPTYIDILPLGLSRL